MEISTSIMNTDIGDSLDDHLESALRIASHYHFGQYRRDGRPYIIHPKRVAEKILVSWTSDRKPEHGILTDFTREEYLLAVIVGYLHDVIEDTSCCLHNLIELGYDMRVIEAVDILTKREGQSYAEYIDLVKTNKIARCVKYFDMIDNLNDSPTLRQINKYAVGLSMLMDE